MINYVFWYYMNNIPSAVFCYTTYADNRNEAFNKFEVFLAQRGLAMEDVTIYYLQERNL